MIGYISNYIIIDFYEIIFNNQIKFLSDFTYIPISLKLNTSILVLIINVLKHFFIYFYLLFIMDA